MDSYTPHSGERKLGIFLLIATIPLSVLFVFSGWIVVVDYFTAVASGIVVAMILAGAGLWYHSKRGNLKTAEQVSNDESRPNYSHLEAHLFWESWRYNMLAKWFKAKDYHWRLPRAMLLVNKDSKDVFLVDPKIRKMIKADLISPIDWKIKKGIDYGAWAESKGLRYNEEYPTDEQLKPIVRKTNEEPQELLADNELMEGVWYYPKRSPKVLKDFVSSVKDEFIVIATQYGKLGYDETKLKEMLARKVKVSFYVVNPDSPTLPAAQGAKIVSRNTRGKIIESLETFCEFKKSLGEPEQSRFNLFKYKEPPIHSMIIIDRSMLQIESYLYDTDDPTEQRPSLVISKDLQPELFDSYHRTVQWIIDHSELHDCHKI